MSKRRKTGYKIDSEYFAQLDYLGAEYSAALEKIEEQNKDIRKLIALLVEHDVPIPGNIIDQYIRRAPEETHDIQEVEKELPFN
ncbi:hypothetical protein [Anaerostipes butyraticus]|uniref:Uncharacterized protein n=1 Tax=Anaerostipes butyraticus TaxID=645466 RepID=A0A916VC18_9FIRM|nr:hypothetical protein [Anaerostipes butyraticus]GFO84175.1 hypothetical protein ANBU17_05220 [Anaerostipes butyraticus]